MTANRPEGHVPIAPAWTVERLPDHTVFSTVYVRGTGRAATVDELRAELTEGADTPTHLERARLLNSDDQTTVFLAYWTDPESQQRWCRRARSLTRPGVLMETAVIPAERCETIYSAPAPAPGMRNLGEVELTDVHEYWGASRDRIPACAASRLASEPGTPLPGNLCMVRGGQVWEACGEAERSMFFEKVEPRLDVAMDFLTNNRESGSIACRYMRDQSLDGEDLDSSSFVVWFRDFQNLEDWTSAHPTHLNTHGSFVQMVIDLEFEYELLLWHDVAVIPAGGVHFAGTEESPLLAA